MSVILLTTFVGLALAGFFVALFLKLTNAGSGREQDALMPLSEETPSVPKSLHKH